MMMRHFLPALGCALVLCLALPSCLDDDSLEQDDTPLGNFEAAWRALDEHYCFFDEKGVDWDAVYRDFRPYFADSAPTMLETFNKLDEMLDLLRDGHVNIYAPFNTARYHEWVDNYPLNFDANLLDRYYLGAHYWSAGGMRFGMFPDSVAYVYYGSFAAAPGETNLDYVLAALSWGKGIIVDVRSNGGGALTGVPLVASRFAEHGTGGSLVYGYMQHKTGRGHSDFSRPEPLELDGRKAGRIYWDAARQPVVVLTNRSTFSAANTFVAAMRSIDGQGGRIVKTVGDRTGGGGGMPFSSVLPNGWILRMSACPIYDHLRQSIEAGIEPDFHVDMDSTAMIVQHRDDIIEFARAYIINNTRMEYPDPDAEAQE